MIDPKTKDQLIEKTLGSHICADMEMLSRTFHSVIGKYSFLFDGDALETQSLLIDVCFPKDIPLLNIEEDLVHFDMQSLIKNIPTDIKDDLYVRILEKFATKITVDDLIPNKKKEGQ